MKRNEANETFGLSFIDLLSCGLGAMALLLLVFASLAVAPPAGSSSHHAHGRVERGPIEPEDGSRRAAATRLVETSSSDAEIVWEGRVDGCEQYDEERGDRRTSLLVCPDGLEPGDVRAVSAGAGTIQVWNAEMTDGAATGPPCTPAAAHEVTFHLDRRTTIQIGEVPCSAGDR